MSAQSLKDQNSCETVNMCVTGKDVVDFAEFLSLVPRLKHQGDSESELLEAFSVFDRDGTGRIASADLRHVVTNLGEKLNEDEADDLIRFADETSQGDVDYRGMPRRSLTSYVDYVIGPIREERLSKYVKLMKSLFFLIIRYF